MFSLRQTGDYDDLAVIAKDEVLNLLQPAEKFIKTIEELILTKTEKHYDKIRVN